jgi:hypothetical protein
MSGNDSDNVQILIAVIGLAGTLGAAFISRPRAAPPAEPAAGPTGAGTVSEPQPQGWPRPDGWQPNQQPAYAGQAPGRAAQPPAAARRLKISLSLWFGIAGCLGCYSFAVAWICGLVGLFFGIRDIRSPGTRRLMKWGLALCIAALVISALLPGSGFIQGFQQGYNSTRG